jgi:hypothetical protein
MPQFVFNPPPRSRTRRLLWSASTLVFAISIYAAHLPLLAAPALSAECTAPPSAPANLTSTISGAFVTLTWTPAASGCPATSYVVHAGTAPGLADITSAPVTTATLTATAASGTYYVFVVAQNAFGASKPSNIVTVVVGSSANPTTGPSIGPGQWRVNINIAAGRYYTNPTSGCYWERQRGFGRSLADIVANEFVGYDAGQWIVDILSTDVGFDTDPRCGTWVVAPLVGAQSSIPPGVWLVGVQLAPGTYRVDASAGCYWARLRDFTSSLSGIIDNDFASIDGQQIVTIAATDVGFENDGDCGIWTPISGVSAADGRDPHPSSQDILLRWMLNQQQEKGREQTPLIKLRAADAESSR